MKRYEFFRDNFIDCDCDFDDCEDGKYVLYEEIKDDRAMLKEAIELLMNVRGALDVGVAKYVDWTEISNLIERAKERGII